MSKMITLLLVSFLFFSCKKNETPVNPITPPVVVEPQYALAWQDEFNGTQMDPVEWYHRIPGIRHDGFND
ncbi:MAG: hypothetical protein B7Y15_12275, partial [Bacteroidetes bacterium 24-39-8]